MNENIVEMQKNTTVTHHVSYVSKLNTENAFISLYAHNPLSWTLSLPVCSKHVLSLIANLNRRCVRSGIFFFFQCRPPFYKLRHQGVIVVHNLKSRDICTSKLNFQQVSISKSLDIKHTCVIPLQVNLSCVSTQCVFTGSTHTGKIKCLCNRFHILNSQCFSPHLIHIDIMVGP